MPASPPSAPAPGSELVSAPRRPRLAALDAARALGVLAMVMGHTLDAVLSPAARQTPAMVRYWQARGFTAPLFLLVSGWAVTLAISRSNVNGWAIPRGRLRRVILLLVIGYGLRWPGWAFDRFLDGDRDIWAHFLAFDALHAIAVSLFATSLVLALPWRRLVKATILAGLAAGAVYLGARAGTPGDTFATAAGLPRSIPAMALVQAIGGTSAFPLFPWAVYFFAGTLVGLLAPLDRRGVAGIAVAGAALLLVTSQFGRLGVRTPGDPVLVAFRVGVVLAVLALLSLVPAAAARWVAPLGKSSLGVYAIHLPIVYGWSTFPGLSWRVGQKLSAWAGVCVALLVMAGSYVAYRLLSRLAREVRARWAARSA